MHPNFLKTIIFITLNSIALTLNAWLITPSMETVTPEKPQTFFTLLSDNEESPIAIEIFACDRDIDENGNESEQPNSKEFFIYPSNLILQPGQKRNVRVIWKGDKNIKEEKAYRIVAETLPVDFAKGEDVEKNIKFQVQMGTQCLCAFYVEPKGVSEKINLKKIDIGNDNEHKYLDLYIENQGTKHGLLKDYSLSIQTPNGSFTYPNDAFLKALNNGYNVLPKKIRKVRIELEDTFVLGTEVNVNFIKK